MLIAAKHYLKCDSRKWIEAPNGCLQYEIIGSAFEELVLSSLELL